MDACQKAKKNGGKLHLMGLLSDGGVHSHITHLFALIDLAKQQGLDNVYVHCIMDGRDTPPSSGIEYVQQLAGLHGQGAVSVRSPRSPAASGPWTVTSAGTASRRLTQPCSCGVGDKADCPICAMKNSYKNEKTDEFVVPCVIQEDGKPVATVEAGDSMIFFNFRPDRAREITRAFVDADFTGFPSA